MDTIKKEFENRLNKSDSESYYTLTNRSFYNKIKPKNVEIIKETSQLLALSSPISIPLNVTKQMDTAIRANEIK